MNKWKTSFFVTLISLVITNTFWIIIVINQGVSYSYLIDSYNYKNASIAVFETLTLEKGKGYTQKDILSILRKHNPSTLIVEEDNKISIEGITFIFEDTKLISVKETN